MSIITSPLLLGADGVTQYQVSRSLRFNSADSAYLNRTPASAGNRKTWTWAGWVKRTTLGTTQNIFDAAESGTGNPRTDISFNNSDVFNFQVNPTGSSWLALTTSQVFRDVSAWGHLVIAVDTTQATDLNRVKLYWNGVQITQFSSTQYPSQNTDLPINNSWPHSIGRYQAGAAQYLSASLAEIHFIDGQALTPSSFTETDATTGQLIPKAYSGGSYGTNGFKLNFSDNSTVAALGTDTSGNGNTWTVNNLSVTAGSGNDSLVDTPTSYGTDTGVGGEVRGNYATLNPLDSGSSGTLVLSNGNLEAAQSTGLSVYRCGPSTVIPNSGKYYAEFVMSSIGTGSNAGVGVIEANHTRDSYAGGSSNGVGYLNDGRIFINSSNTTNFNTFTTTDVIGVAVDYATGKVWFAKNNTWQNSGDPAAGTNAVTTLNPANSMAICGTTARGSGASGTASFVANFGQRAFAYTAPSGFKALCDTNLPTPVVAKSNTVMDTVLYTGNGAARSITGLAFNPDLVWIKSRSVVRDHELTDSVRGVTKSLSSNLTAVEATDAGGLTAFNSDGFSLGTDVKYNAGLVPTTVNLAWTSSLPTEPTWSNYPSLTTLNVTGLATITVNNVSGAGTNTGVTYWWSSSSTGPWTRNDSYNFTEFPKTSYTYGNYLRIALYAGSDIATGTLTVSSGEPYVAWAWDAGTSTVTNTAGSISSQVRANASAGFSIVTATTPASGTFTIGHGLGVAPSFVITKTRAITDGWYSYHKSLGPGSYISLNRTDASLTNNQVWQNTDPSSTVVYGTAGQGWNTSASYVIYCFAPVTGYSSFGSYTGNGSADGPFVFTGHRSRWILIKRTDTTANWRMFDTARDTYNVSSAELYPNLSNSETAFSALDINSNGFKIRTSDPNYNSSGGTYIYASFAENPFQYARAR